MVQSKQLFTYYIYSITALHQHEDILSQCAPFLYLKNTCQHVFSFDVSTKLKKEEKRQSKQGHKAKILVKTIFSSQ